MIDVVDLEVKYGDRPAVRNLSFTVRPGEIYALLGGNGAGKTSTLSAVLGLVPPTKGSVVVDGARVGPGARPRVVYVPEVVDLYPELDPIETLALFAGVAGRAADEAAFAAALEQSGLPADQHHLPVGTFSKGMRQKVALALSEARGARTLVLDEPTSGLDPLAADQLASRLRAARADGAAILMSTHDVLHAAGLADRVGVLVEGRLAQQLDARGLDAPALLEAYRAARSSAERSSL